MDNGKKQQRTRLHQQLTERVEQAYKQLDNTSGRAKHDAHIVVNLFDEMRNVAYTLKRKKQWQKTITTAKRMAGMIGDKTLRASVMQEIETYSY